MPTDNSRPASKPRWRNESTRIGSQFTGLKVTTYTPENTVDLLIDMPSSTLDLNTRVVTSQERTTISRADFTDRGRQSALRHRGAARHSAGQREDGDHGYSRSSSRKPANDASHDMRASASRRVGGHFPRPRRGAERARFAGSDQGGGQHCGRKSGGRRSAQNGVGRQTSSRPRRMSRSRPRFTRTKPISIPRNTSALSADRWW